MVVKRTREKTIGSPATPASRKKVAKTAEGLDGLKIVITGETEILARSILESKLKDAGASVTTAVSGVTNILIYGPKLEDGRPTEMSTKFKKAEELITTGKSKVGLRLMSEVDFFKEFPDINPSANFNNAAVGSDKPQPSNSKSELWTERWRPAEEADFRVNHAAYIALRDWLNKWTFAQESERACLLTGPPGLGKTSAALAVCKSEGFELLEMNASDTRSKKRLKELHPLIWGGCTLNRGNLNSKLCLLMDEADGLSAGDRGGSDELCRMIKMSRIPIIATCNDKQHPKVKTLSKYCRVIDFSKPDAAAAVARGLQIARAEGCTDIDESFVQRCYQAGNGDMRALINALQAHASGQKQIGVQAKDIVTYEDVFAVARKLVMNSNSQPTSALLNYFFFDYDMIPLIIQENCPKSLVKNKDEIQALNQLCKMTDSICYGDIIMSRVRERGQWDLLPDAGIFSSLIPAKCANAQQMYRMDFPGLLGRISARNKKRRQLADLRGRTGHTDGVTDGLFELLGNRLLEPLTKAEDFDEFFKRVDAYHLDNKEIVTDMLMNVRHKLSPSPYEGLPTKVKTKLTKAWAARDLITSKKRGKGSAAAAPTTPSDSEDEANTADEVDIVDEPPY